MSTSANYLRITENLSSASTREIKGGRKDRK